jgi:tungstate transport system permease protein
MDLVGDGIRGALDLLLRGDPETYAIAWLSLWVSGVSTVAASLVGIPLGITLGLRDFPGKGGVRGVLNTLFGLPTVVVGLVLFSLLSRRGPFGALGLLYTPYAMILGQFVLATPIVTALTLSAVEGADRRILDTARTLGASPSQARWTLLAEIRFAILAAVMAGFGRVFAEVGVAMMLGGNIRGSTRTLTTGIALQTSRGEFELGVALGIILLVLAFLVNIGTQVFKTRSAA